MTSFSIITLIWKRDVGLLDRMLTTLDGQDLLPLEVIVVDINVDDQEHKRVIDVCNKHKNVIHIAHPMEEFHASRAVNIGIRKSSPSADYLAVCGAEMLYSRNYLSTVAQAITPGHFTHTRCGTLPEDVTVPDDPYSAWDELCTAIIPLSNKTISPGTFMCAARSWWFDVRGIDEGIYFLLFDVDYSHRAVLSGLEKLDIAWTDAQALHQWHEPSPLFYTARGKWYPQVLDDTTIIRNPESWGTIV